MSSLTILSLIVFIILYFLFKREYLSLYKLYIFSYKFKTYLRKKNQKNFYLHERFKEKIYLFKKYIYNFNGYFLSSDRLLNRNIIKLEKKFKEIILIVFNRKDKYFDYQIDKKKYSRKIDNSCVNFFKFNTKDRKNFLITKKNQLIFNPIYVKKNRRRSQYYC